MSTCFFASRADALGSFSFPSPSLIGDDCTRFEADSRFSPLPSVSFLGDPETSLEASVRRRSELPMLIFLLSEWAFRLRLGDLVPGVFAEEDIASLAGILSLSAVASSSKLFFSVGGVCVVLLVSLFSVIVVVWAESSTARGFESWSFVMEVDDSSAFFGAVAALGAFVDAAAAALLLFWFDFLAAGRKLVRLFLVDFDPRGINETPGSGILLFVKSIE